MRRNGKGGFRLANHVADTVSIELDNASMFLENALEALLEGEAMNEPFQYTEEAYGTYESLSALLTQIGGFMGKRS